MKTQNINFSCTTAFGVKGARPLGTVKRLTCLPRRLVELVARRRLDSYGSRELCDGSSDRLKIIHYDHV
jgi:hypothetical protein